MSVPTTNVPAKKKVNIADVMIAILPLFLMFTLNTICTLPGFAVGFYEMSKSGNTETITNIAEVANGPMAQTAISIGLITYSVLAIVICYIWYKKAFLKKQIKIENKEVFNVKTVVLTILGTIGVWSIINLALILVNYLAPDLMESFNNLMKVSGIGTNPITTFFYVSLLGPIAEELLFRGLTQGYLRKAGLPVAAVLIGQAIMFGIAHMNPVQSTYAAFIGVFIGLIRYKYGNIRICCLAHIVNNTISSYGSLLAERIGMSDTVTYVFFGIMSVVAVVVIVLLIKEPSKDKEIDLKVAA